MPTLNLASILKTSASKFPQKDALVIGETHITYAQLYGMSLKIASALNGLGIDSGANVALMLPNVPQFSAAYFGVLSRGSAVVPLNVLLKSDEVAYHLEHSEAQAVFVWEGFLTEGQKGFEQAHLCKHLIVVPQDPKNTKAFDGAHNFNALLAKATPLQEIAAKNPEDRAVILYTSGTTGNPKGAALTHFNIWHNAQYTSGKLLLNKLSHEDVYLCTLPLFHSFAQTVVQNSAIFIGATIVLLPRFDAKQALTLMQQHGVTFFAGVPTMYFAMLNHPEGASFDLPSLRFCVSGGSAMPVEVMKAFDKKYGVNILEGYGLSETSPVASFNALDRPKIAGSIGIPIDHVEFKLVDNDGKTVSKTGERGEICIRGPNVMNGYYKNPEATKAALSEDGWFSTGDVAMQDENGYFFIVDRKKDIIIRGGFNVYPREIEEVLYQHEAIAEAAVIGIPDEKYGEEIKAVVALKPGISAVPDDIMAFCKEKMAAFKYPRVVEIMDALPKGATGKILKRELRTAPSQ